MLDESHKPNDTNPSKTQIQNNTKSLESDKEPMKHLLKILNL